MRKDRAGAAPHATGTLDTLIQQVGFAPLLTSQHLGWKTAHLSKWKGCCPSVQYPAFDDVVVVLQTGEGHWRVRHQQRWLDHFPGRITIIPPGTPIDWREAGHIECWTLHLPMQSFDNLRDGVPGERLVRNIPLSFAADDRLLHGMISALGRELEAPLDFGELYVPTISDAIKLHLLRRSPEDRDDPAQAARLPRAALNRVLDCIEASIGTGISLAELAELSGRCRSQFTAEFRASTGRSPLQYFRERRIERAKEKLRHSNESIIDIALSLGFSGQAHFSTGFRSATGITPSRYRRNAR